MSKSISLNFKVLLVITLLPISASADMFTPSASCSKPYKPYEFTDKYQVDRFKSDVDSYKRCITDFVDEQNTASKKHLKAASDAIDEWNSYVRYELK
jgi:hypothetical protein